MDTKTIIDTPSNKMIEEMSAIMAYHENVCQGLQKVIDFFNVEIDQATQYIEKQRSDGRFFDSPEDLEFKSLERRNEVMTSYSNSLKELQRYHQVEYEFIQSEIDIHISKLSDQAN